MSQPSKGILRIFIPWRGLIWQLFVITILPLAALTVVIAFGSLAVYQRAMRVLVGERDERAVKTAAASLEEQLKHRESAMRGLARLVEAGGLVLAVSPGRERMAAGASSTASLVRHTLTSAFASGSQAAVVVVDSDEDLLYQGGSFSYVGDATAHPGIAEALRGESGATYVQVGDSEHVVTYSPVAPVGWALVLEEPWETVDTPTLRTTQIAPLVLVPVLLLTLVALWFGLRWIVQPLQALESQAATLAWGEFGAIEQPVGGITEIRRLQNVARHAQATQADLHIFFTPQEITLQASDNSKGFDVPKSPAEFAPSGHFGLLSLYERAELIGARLEIFSLPGHGSQVIIHLPV